MNEVLNAKSAGGPPLQLFNCTHAGCGATFTKQWRLKEHDTVHTGEVTCINKVSAKLLHTFSKDTYVNYFKNAYKMPTLFVKLL